MNVRWLIMVITPVSVAVGLAIGFWLGRPNHRFTSLGRVGKTPIVIDQNTGEVFAITSVGIGRIGKTGEAINLAK